MAEDLAGWDRVGGRRLQFYAADDEIAEWLLEMLPEQFAPYMLLGTEWREKRWQGFAYPLDRIGEAFARHRDESFWIGSDLLSPGLGPDDEDRLSLSGLIQVQLGQERQRRLGDASIAMLDRIRHAVTGRERRHAEYRRIFERLRRSMRKRLVVRTLRTFPDRSVSEDWPMTARAAAAHVRGEVTFMAEPVGLRD